MSETPPEEPTGPRLVVTAEAVGRRVGAPNPTTEQSAVIVDAIVDAQDDVATYLRRPLFPTRVEYTGVTPAPGADPLSWRAWTHVDDFDDDITVVSAVAAADGTYTLTLDVGLSADGLAEVARYVRAAAVEDLRGNPSSGFQTKQVGTVSAEGQSVSYKYPDRKAGQPGGPPTIESLAHLRRHSGQAFRRNRGPRPPWPMTDTPIGWDPS